MFEKAHLKLFGIIASILVAVFIALLGSVNIITKAVMQRQSQQVLRQIAEGVEYDDKTSTFTFVRPENFDDRRDDKPPSKPYNEPEKTAPMQTSVTTSSETTTASETTVTTTVAVETAYEPVQETEEQQTEPETEEIYDEPETEAPSQEETEANEPTSPPTTALPPVVTTAPASPPKSPAAEQSKPEHEKPEPPAEPEKPHEPQKKDEWKNPWEQWWQDGNYNGPFPSWDWGQWNFGENPYIGLPEWNGDAWNSDYSGFADEDEIQNESVLFVSGDESGGIIQLADKAQNEADFHREEFGKPYEPVPKSLGSIDFFVIMADDDGNYLATLNNEDITAETAQNYISAILSDGAQTGMVNHTFQFYRQPKSNGTLMVFTDKSAEMDTLDQLKRTTIIIGIISIIILSAAAFFLSKKSIEPIKLAFERQKRFVSDASHELKTPLTVISANADVLADEIGDNKWLTYIKSQTDRMNVLVNDLLNLTRLENNTTDFICVDFDLSRAAENTALPFECQAFEMNRKFIVDIDEGISVNGSEKHIKQMMAIFIDNAIKYSNEGGTVKVTLSKHGDKKVFSVFNTGTGVREDEKEKIFERFYRSDESRNRATGGYGLGLAIAKSVIDKHKFKVHVENQEGKSICFVVTMQ